MKRLYAGVLLCFALTGCFPANVMDSTPIAVGENLSKPLPVEAFVMGEFTGSLGGRFKDLLATRLESHKFKLLWDTGKPAGDYLLVANVESSPVEPGRTPYITAVTLRVVQRSTGETLWRYNYQRRTGVFFGQNIDEETTRDIVAALEKNFYSPARRAEEPPVTFDNSTAP
ncbi:hypothetical protein [Deinococcus cellulosilyticus]|uniref:Lipoprotein n=1 Tax=Deinococcus cellulosilyticus (strain DSM 18568 / NBRC 106333 / KACC 11606 / 5516J-15) TaxID=1223518 RepID=A0A511MXC2_DEIC1|nr:hypothetical protein [Deinococcus cellulosilyticus]GEM44918.1 hypothetical protein DC3_05530 [Deinococcus cellulosilyticus NBRC 106333 = KACC 11606]